MAKLQKPLCIAVCGLLALLVVAGWDAAPAEARKLGRAGKIAATVAIIGASKAIRANKASAKAADDPAPSKTQPTADHSAAPVSAPEKADAAAARAKTKLDAETQVEVNTSHSAPRPGSTEPRPAGAVCFAGCYRR